MNCHSRFFIRSFYKTEYFARAFIEPIFLVVDMILAFNFMVPGMSMRNCLFGQARNVEADLLDEVGLPDRLAGVQREAPAWPATPDRDSS